jgi:hypothetical protein
MSIWGRHSFFRRLRILPKQGLIQQIACSSADSASTQAGDSRTFDVGLLRDPGI